MSSICTEHHHPLFTTKKLLHHQADINNLPPRKLLTRRSNLIPISISSFDDFTDENPLTPELTPNFPHKFLPYNSNDDDDELSDDPYSTDDFRIYEFKVRRCMRSRSHDWTDCPFAHPGEKARRRDPRRFHYSGNACSDFRRGNCPRGDSCEFAHGVFECWLHPARYRTQVCKDGKNCKRKVCFFAHTPKQLRILPQSQSPQSPDHHPLTDHQFSLSKTKTHNCCCVYCHSSSSVSSSPTSTLMGFSHLSSNSPPLSPTTTIINSPSSTSELSNKQQQSLLGMLSYKNKLMELVSSLEAMDLNEVNSPTNTSVNDQSNYFTWGSCVSSPNYEHPQQFILSPDSTRQATRSSKDFFSEDYELNNINGGSCPDLEWVNELVM